MRQKRFEIMIPTDKLQQIKQRFAFLEAKLSEGVAGDFAVLSKEYSDLRPVVEKIQSYQILLSDIEDTELLMLIQKCGRWQPRS